MRSRFISVASSRQNSSKKSILAHQLALKGAQHWLFDFLTRNGQPVRAYTPTARAEASEVLA
jgi:hypothetical protein